MSGRKRKTARPRSEKPEVQHVFRIPETPRRRGPIPASVRRYIRDVPASAVVIAKGEPLDPSETPR